MDEKDIADLKYRKTTDNVKKSFEVYFDGETEEDKIEKSFVNEMKAMQAEIIKNIIAEVKFHKEAILGSGILSSRKVY